MTQTENESLKSKVKSLEDTLERVRIEDVARNKKAQEAIKDIFGLSNVLANAKQN